MKEVLLEFIKEQTSHIDEDLLRKKYGDTLEENNQRANTKR